MEDVLYRFIYLLLLLLVCSILVSKEKAGVSTALKT